MRVGAWLTQASRKLKGVGIDSAHLDAELLISYVTGQDRATLLAHPELALDHVQQQYLKRLLDRRLRREPLAYIVEGKEFYGREFYVNRHVLIPRAETEAFISSLAKLPMEKDDVVIDIGTGSGCIAVTTALEFPKLRVVGWDIDEKALRIARKNALHLSAKVRYAKRDIRQPVKRPSAKFVLANLPYVDRLGRRSPETDFEPRIALFASNHGLALIEDLLDNHPLKHGGYLLLEADVSQHKSIIKEAKNKSFKYLSREGLILTFQLL
ncbi:MAG TPA: HemK/PrmC family methyltransferase [Candidatus Saccharimonadales bacterium]|nr:HemK/PrmC family methyltransferase [Candidatus Saccharimonadales bacterium]